MNISGLDLNLLNVFDAIYRKGSLTRAGVTIGLSQPAVSHALGRLRILLKDPLFQRTSHGIKPTPRADSIAVPISHALEIIRDCLRDSLKEPVPSLIFTKSVAGDLPFFLEKLDEAFPGVRFQVRCVTTDHVLEAMRSGTADIGLVMTGGIQPGSIEGLKHQHAYSSEIHFVAAESHRLAHQRDVRLSDLAGERFIWFNPRVAPDFHRKIDQLCRAAGFPFKISEVALDQESLLSTLQAGHAVSFMPAILANYHTPGLRYLPIRDSMPLWNIDIIWRRELNPAATSCLGEMKKICSALDYKYGKRPRPKAKRTPAAAGT